MSTELKIEYLPTSALKPYEKNARKHKKLDVDNIAMSIEKYGMNDAIGIWGKDNIIVEGHGRFEACKKLGIDTVPVVRLTMRRRSCRSGILIFLQMNWLNWILADLILTSVLMRTQREKQRALIWMKNLQKKRLKHIAARNVALSLR